MTNEDELENKTSFTEEEKRGLFRQIPDPDKMVVSKSVSRYIDQSMTATVARVKEIRQVQLRHEETRLKLGEVASIGKFPDEKAIEVFSKKYAANFINALIDPKKDSKGNSENRPRKGHKIARGSEAYIVIGTSGSGKTSKAKNIARAKNALFIEADAYKAALVEEFKCDINHENMHNASMVVVEEVKSLAMQNKLNFVLEKIGDEPNQIYNMANDFIKNDYKVNLDVVHVDEVIAGHRNIDRVENGSTNRLVPQKDVNKMDNGALLTYLLLNKKHPELFASCNAWCNEADYKYQKGLIPLKTLSYRNGKKQYAGDPHFEDISNKSLDMCIKAMGCVLEKLESVHKELAPVLDNLNMLLQSGKSGREEFEQNVADTLSMSHNGQECKLTDLITADLYTDISGLNQNIMKKIYNPENIIARDTLEEDGVEQNKDIIRGFMLEELTGEKQEVQIQDSKEQILGALLNKTEERLLDKRLLQQDGAGGAGVMLPPKQV